MKQVSVPDFSILGEAYPPPVSSLILDFLNSGGTGQEVISHLGPREVRPASDLRKGFFERDVTGDGVPELFVRWDYIFYVFGCFQGEYVILLEQVPPLLTFAPEVESVQDMNLDGIPEIVTSTRLCLWDRCATYAIYEWNGDEFESLIDTPDHPDYHMVDQSEPSGMSLEDIDANGTIELLLRGGVPPESFEGEYYDGLPWREETNIYMWNGTAYVFLRTDYTPPEYRFQAIQDGDRAAEIGEYDEALDFYQQAIFSDELDWWSPERQCYMQPPCRGYGDMFLLTPTPTPIPSPMPDPNEYDNLAAYAQFRIMLLHVLRGWSPEARTVYDTLQAKFPEGQVGHAYAEMATAFWSEYQSSRSLNQACGKAIAYARANPDDILTSIGSDYHGFQARVYEPEDVCPFHGE